MGKHRLEVLIGVSREGEPGMVKVYSYFDREDFSTLILTGKILVDLPRTVCEDVCAHRCTSISVCVCMCVLRSKNNLGFCLFFSTLFETRAHVILKHCYVHQDSWLPGLQGIL